MGDTLLSLATILQKTQVHIKYENARNTVLSIGTVANIKVSIFNSAFSNFDAT